MAADKELYYKIVDGLELFAKVYNRFEFSGEENLPDEGGVLLCPLHENYSDPFYVAVAARKRVLHFLAWHGIGDMPLIGPLFKKVGTMHSIEESYGVALDKSQAKEVLGEMGELLRAGEACAVFPTGAIKHWIYPKGKEYPYKPGAVRLAATAGVPIIPVGLSGTRWVAPNIINYHDFGGPDKGIFIPGALPVKVRLKFGEPFYPDPDAADNKEVAERETQKLKEKIESLVLDIKPDNLLGYIF